MKKKHYTLMIIPSAHSRVRKFVVREKVLNVVVSLTGLFLVALSLFLVDYTKSQGKLRELKQLRAEVKTQRVQVVTLAQNMVDLENGMSRLRKFEAKLRTAFDLDHDYYSQASLLGVGGGEATLADMVNSLDSRQKELISKIEQDLERLKGDIDLQERGFSELTEFLEDQKSMLVATPSIMPVKGWVTSGFKRRKDPFTQRLVWHRGMDISTNTGTPVIAPADGLVTYSGRKVDFGNIVTIDHGYGYITRYGHNSKNLVRAGQRVKRGQVIAFVGNTGRSTGPHLHYEVIRTGIPANPMNYILNK